MNNVCNTIPTQGDYFGRIFNNGAESRLLGFVNASLVRRNSDSVRGLSIPLRERAVVHDNDWHTRRFLRQQLRGYYTRAYQNEGHQQCKVSRRWVYQELLNRQKLSLQRGASNGEGGVLRAIGHWGLQAGWRVRLFLIAYYVAATWGSLEAPSGTEHEWIVKEPKGADKLVNAHGQYYQGWIDFRTHSRVAGL